MTKGNRRLHVASMRGAVANRPTIGCTPFDLAFARNAEVKARRHCTFHDFAGAIRRGAPEGAVVCRGVASRCRRWSAPPPGVRKIESARFCSSKVMEEAGGSRQSQSPKGTFRPPDRWRPFRFIKYAIFFRGIDSFCKK